MTQMLALSPVADIVVVDVAKEKLQVARQMGARATFVASPTLTAELDHRSGGRKYDIVVDCTGLPAVIEGLFAHAAPAARIMLFGVASPKATIRIIPFDVYHRDWEIIGSMAINGTFQQARELVASGRITVRPLLTRVAGLDDVAAILGRAKTAEELKTMIAP
jgi:threonine dehydrogenase-like Zn-dependent dehydrogenase